MCEYNGMILGMTAVVIFVVVVSVVGTLFGRFYQWLTRPTPVSMESIDSRRLTRRHRGDA